MSNGSVLALVRSLISQLLDVNRGLILQIPWKPSNSHPQDLKILMDILLTILRNLEHPVFCIIDGLDECEEDSLGTLISFIDNISSASNVRTVLTYCQNSLIDRRIQGSEIKSSMEFISLHNSNDTDVIRYTSKVCAEFTKSRSLPPSLAKQLLVAMEDKHQGRFIWVTLVLQVLGRLEKLSEIRKFLEALPSDLDTIYQRVLNCIRPDKKNNICWSLYFLQHATRPLSVSELSMILAIEESMTVVSEVMDNVVISLKDDLRMELGHVLVIEDGNIFFAHPDIGQFVGQGTTKPPGEDKDSDDVPSLHRVEDVADTVDRIENQDGKDITKPLPKRNQATKSSSKGEGRKWTIKPLLKDGCGKGISTEEVHYRLASACLTYLVMEDLLDGLPQDLRELLKSNSNWDDQPLSAVEAGYRRIFTTVPLLEYACYFWPYHLLKSGKKANMLLRLSTNSSKRIPNILSGRIFFVVRPLHQLISREAIPH